MFALLSFINFITFVAADLSDITFVNLYSDTDVDHFSSGFARGGEGQAAETRALGGSCSFGSTCSRLSDCPSFGGIVASACLQGDSSLFCGSTLGSDPLVCCPQGSGTIPSNPGDTIPPGRDECGKSMVYGQQYNGLGAYPFVARIGFKNSNTGTIVYPCTGSIISSRVILTAAHCALAKADGHRLSSVRVGDWDSAEDPDCANAFCARPSVNHVVSHVIVHPGYVKGAYAHDVAMLVLRTPFNHSVTAQPICLHSNKDTDMTNTRALLVGWGKMAVPAARPTQQQHLWVPVLPTDRCTRVYSGHVNLPPPGAWLCAGGEPGGDACQGFGGAPLVIRQNRRFVQVGIMSFGSDKCGAAGVASVYTKVAHYAQWIADNMPIS